jgi:hypothetical protein
MSIAEFEPNVWIPASHPAAPRAAISLDGLARMDVIHGPRRACPASYDAFRTMLRAAEPRFDFTDPPFRHSLPMTLAFAATAGRPTAVLTNPHRVTGTPIPAQPDQPADTYHMTAVRLEGCPLTAVAALVWSGDLPRQLQQALFDTADGITC